MELQGHIINSKSTPAVNRASQDRYFLTWCRSPLGRAFDQCQNGQANHKPPSLSIISTQSAAATNKSSMIFRETTYVLPASPTAKKSWPIAADGWLCDGTPAHFDLDWQAYDRQAGRQMSKMVEIAIEHKATHALVMSMD
jgi:hypothetical protein